MNLTNATLYNKRVEKKMTRPQLAVHAGVSWETIKAYEVKGATPSLVVAMRIAKGLDTTVEYLFGKLIETQTELETVPPSETRDEVEEM